MDGNRWMIAKVYGMPILYKHNTKMSLHYLIDPLTNIPKVYYVHFIEKKLKLWKLSNHSRSTPVCGEAVIWIHSHLL